MQRTSVSSQPYTTQGGTAVIEVTETCNETEADEVRIEVQHHYFICPPGGQRYRVGGTLKDAILVAEYQCSIAQAQAAAKNTRPKVTFTYRTTVRSSQHCWIDCVETTEDATEARGIAGATKIEFVLRSEDGAESSSSDLSVAVAELDRIEAAAPSIPGTRFRN